MHFRIEGAIEVSNWEIMVPHLGRNCIALVQFLDVSEVTNGATAGSKKVRVLKAAVKVTNCQGDDSPLLPSKCSIRLRIQALIRAFPCPAQRPGDMLQMALAQKKCTSLSNSGNLAFFCSQAVGSCNLVLLVHLLRWGNRKSVQYSRIGATPIVQVTLVRRDWQYAKTSKMSLSWIADTRQRKTRVGPARNPGTPRQVPGDTAKSKSEQTTKATQSP